MNYYLYKLIPPRPSFALDMTSDEASVMGAHGEYWQALLEAGHAVVFGPVLDPAGGWGLAVVEAPDEETVRQYGAADPAVRSGLGTFEVFAMPATSARRG